MIFRKIRNRYLNMDQRIYERLHIPVISALTFFLRIPFWSRPFEMDEGLYAYGGWQILKGLILYRDLYDLKPPGIYYLNALLFSFAP